MVASINPRIVYGAITGYGAAGPWKDKPGQDLLVQSLSGLAWLSGDADQGPVPTGVSVVDIMTGAQLARAFSRLLVGRSATGKGALIEVNLMTSAMDIQFEAFTTYLNSRTGQPPRSKVNNASVTSAAPYGVYATADGYIAIAMAPIGRARRSAGCAALRPYANAARCGSRIGTR